MAKLAKVEMEDAILRHFEEEGLEVVCRQRREAWCIYWAEDMEPLARLRPVGEDDLVTVFFWDGARWVNVIEGGFALPLSEALRFITEDPFDLFDISSEDEDFDEDDDLDDGDLRDEYWDADLDEDDWERPDLRERVAEETARALANTSADLAVGRNWPTRTLESLAGCGTTLVGLATATVGAAAADLRTGLWWALIAWGISFAICAAWMVATNWRRVKRVAFTAVPVLLLLALVAALLASGPLLVGASIHQAIGSSFWGAAAGVVAAWFSVFGSVISGKVARCMGAVIGVTLAMRLVEAFGWSSTLALPLLGAFFALAGATAVAWGLGAWFLLTFVPTAPDDRDS